MVTTSRPTYQDYVALEGDERYELLDGELILIASPNRDHQTVSLRFASRMLSFADENDLGWVYSAPFDVLFTDTDVRRRTAGRHVISRQNHEILTPANVQGAPDLLVEILSPSSSRRDWGAKRDLCARHGVREYWIIDPTNRLVSVLRLRDDVLVIEQTHTEDNTARSSVLEGFSVNLAQLFAD